MRFPKWFVCAEASDFLREVSSMTDLSDQPNARLRAVVGVAKNQANIDREEDASNWSIEWQNFAKASQQVNFTTGSNANGVNDLSRRLQTRLRQVQYGYNTVGYVRYLQLVPREVRSRNQIGHPRTPDPYQIWSKRSYDGQVKKWRRLLHRYDIAGGENISTVAKAEQDKELCQISMNATSGVHSFVTNKQMTSTVSLELSQPRGLAVCAVVWEEGDEFFGLI